MGFPTGLVVLLAVVCGAAVANIYYAQPLLHTIGGRSSSPTAPPRLLVTASQAGYVAGLLLVVPLGDLLERRRLVCGCSCWPVRWSWRAAAPGFGVLAAALASSA